MSPFFNAQRNLEEFREVHGFLPADVVWEPQTTLQDRRDNRDPGELGRAILGKVKRWPTTGVCTHANRVLA